MKRLIYFLFVLLGLSSCMIDDKISDIPEVGDNKVDIVFGVEIPEIPATKALGEEPNVQNLMVAVFGGSGFLKEYVQAVPEETQLATHNGTHYKYRVRLSLSDSHLKVHFIANGPETLPFRYEDEVMSALYTEKDPITGDYKDAYWQKIELPDGITAEKYPDDWPEVGKRGTYKKDAKGEYIVTQETANHFQIIPLIRNFAKIVVTATDECLANDFELLSYAVVNKPTKGSVAPYNTNTSSFIMDYKDKTYDDLIATAPNGYPGNIPADATMDKTIPSASDFQNTPFYMYERPIPTSDATYILVYGNYLREGTPEPCYYRLELMDDNGYFAIYRNFQYQVTITAIKRLGSETPEDAVNAAGSGDVSTDTKTENLSDISDGHARLYVEYMEKTIVGGGGTVTLKYKFLPPDSEGKVSNNPANGEGVPGVSLTAGTPGATGAVINSAIQRQSTDDTDGWRTLSFTAATASDVTKTQTITVQGNYNYNGSHRIFRNVTFKLMQIQELTVICDPKEIEVGKDRLMDVLIQLPLDLPRSIFPIKLKIEPQKLNLTPYNDNLPVATGKSLADGTTSTYYFIKELSYPDYQALEVAALAAGDSYVTVTTHFKTTKESSDKEVSEVYVTADNYFNTDHDNFKTYTMKTFPSLSFSNYSYNTGGQSVTFNFTMDGTDIPATVTVKLTGLRPATGSTLVPVQGVPNTYTYNNSSLASNASLALETSNDDGVYGAEISANHYYTASLGNLSYDNPRFTSTAAAGRNKPINFEFSYINGIVEPVTFTLTNLKPQSTDGRFQELGDGKWTFTPNDSNLDQTITFQTTAWANVSLSMAGASYRPSTANSTAATTMTIEANSLRFYNDGYTYNETVRMYYNGSSYVTASNNSSYNSAFTITRSSLNSSLKVYFKYRYYDDYSVAISVYDLDEATTGNVLRIDLDNSSAPSLN